ncbi:MAG TPA: aryl-sulfate sulfotransferase [Chitinophagales bacterium]|nr:aryl-sulfate sulfotransferase [Chitinophagales bacterium]
MKNRIRFIICCVLLFLATSAMAQFQYISPLPGSKIHHKETNIILKNGSFIKPASLRSDLVSITGTKSGGHHARIVLSDDKKTIVIYPEPIFQDGETVVVTVRDGFEKTDGTVIRGTAFQFETHPEWIFRHDGGTKKTMANLSGFYGDNTSETNSDVRGGGCALIPYQVISNNSAYKADVFYYNFRNTNPKCWARTIISNEGDSLYAGFDDEKGVDFRINHNGYLTYNNASTLEWYMEDSSYSLVKIFQMGNGYKADEHDFQIFSDGYCFMLGLDTVPDQDLTIIGGHDSVNVIGCIIQELDPSGNVIFEWNSFDHFLYTDAIFWIQASAQYVASHDYWDWVHTNSIELDADTTIIVSSRHLSEVTKISLNTGNILWRWGGYNNEFTFFNDDSDLYTFSNHTDTFYFSGQHDVRRLPNGHITMFNNDNNLGLFLSLTPVRSDAKEYVLDEVNKTATLVWHYYHPLINGSLLLQSSGMGSVQRLANGNTFINWGYLQVADNSMYPAMTEVDSVGNIVWEFRWTPSPINIATYRGHKYIWERCNLLIDSTLVSDSITTHSADLSWGDNSKFSGFILQYKLCSDTIWISVPVDTNYFKLEGLQMDSCYEWRLQSICSVYNDTSPYTSIHHFTTQNATSTVSPGSSVSFFRVYPNPTPGEAEIKFTLSGNQNIELILYNILGVAVKHEVIAAHSGMNKVRIDLETMSPGIYTIELKTATYSLRRQLVRR